MNDEMQVPMPDDHAPDALPKPKRAPAFVVDYRRLSRSLEDAVREAEAALAIRDGDVARIRRAVRVLVGEVREAILVCVAHPSKGRPTRDPETLVAAPDGRVRVKVDMTPAELARFTAYLAAHPREHKSRGALIATCALETLDALEGIDRGAESS